MKVAILFGLLAAAHAGVLHAPLLGLGTSVSSRSEDGLGNYAFGYNENHATGGTFRKETGDALGRKVGSYGLSVGDGRVRTVNYVADGLGFRANVQTNEPGVEPKDPAAVLINKAGIAAVPVGVPLGIAAAPIGLGVQSLGLAGPLGVAGPLGIASNLGGVASVVAPGSVTSFSTHLGSPLSYSTNIAHGVGIGAYGLGVKNIGLGLGAYGLGVKNIGLGLGAVKVF